MSNLKQIYEKKSFELNNSLEINSSPKAISDKNILTPIEIIIFLSLIKKSEKKDLRKNYKTTIKFINLFID